MAHIHEKIDFTASIYVVFKNKVLLRMHDKFNIWLPPGGHVELDEDPVQAAVREVKEETGLEVSLWDGNKKFSIDTYESGLELIPPVSLNRHHTSQEHEHINFAYFATTKNDTLNPAEGETRDGLKWCTKQDLETMVLRPDIQFYSKLALDTLGGK
ncbi:MAG TPA: NUDIX domain-containing protein [Candidatus Paceibacterota bacterium]|nr:NUDIX domain-containing protein [Candidatus Paceibacterota bacterium]